MDDADVVIIGSALAGLVAGAILGRHGRRVVILEHADTVGARGRADAAEELAEVVRGLAAAPPAEVEAAIPERLGDWIPAHVRHPGARRALLLMATVIFHPHPEEASTGRLMKFFQTPKGGPFIPDDETVGGMQGLIEPWAKAIRARGGEIALGWKPV